MKSIIEQVFDFAIAAKPGDRVTATNLADRLNLSRTGVNAAIRRLTEEDVYREAGRLPSANGGRHTVVYEVTGKLPDLAFQRRRKLQNSPPNLGELQPPQPATASLSKDELDAMAIALLERVPIDVLKNEVARRETAQHPPKLPPRVASLLGVAA